MCKINSNNTEIFGPDFFIRLRGEDLLEILDCVIWKVCFISVKIFCNVVNVLEQWLVGSYWKYFWNEGFILDELCKKSYVMEFHTYVVK